MKVDRAEGVKSYPERRQRSFGSQLRRTLRQVRWSVALGLIRSAFRVAKGFGRTYEPVEIGGRRFANSRDTDARWTAISQVLQDYGAKNVLDIGCAEGWLIRRAAAECNCFAVGIEASDRVIVGELARLHDRVEGVATARAFMTPEAIRALPQFDAVLCLSVLHHVIRGFGIGTAEEFLRALASRVLKVLIFEIGTADESAWTSVLPEVRHGQETFVTDLLERSGFHRVRVIAESEAFHREVNRILFVAEPISQEAVRHQADGVAC